MAQGEQPSWQKFVMEAGKTGGLPPASLSTVVTPTTFSTGPDLLPQFDPLDALPSSAAERLRMLRQRASDSHAVIPPFETVHEASMARVDAENALRKRTNHAQDFGDGLAPDHPLVVAAQKHLDMMTDNLARLQALQQQRTLAWQAASGALVVCEDFLRFAVPGNCQLAEEEVEAPKVATGALLDAIDAQRRKGRELRATLHTIRSSAFPSSFAKARLREMIDAAAMQGAPVISNMIEHADGKIIWPTQRVQAMVLNVATAPAAVAFHESIDVIAVLCWLHRDALIKRLDAEIDAEADDGNALSPADRERREAETLGDILAQDRVIAELVYAAQRAGLPCEHDSSCSPLALLSLRLVTAPRAEPSGTSFGLSWDLAGGRQR
ncbi:hypothetical protein [Bradyrhizobium sp. 6(2017)]|uniref:hypothetical protein n=1 Tax=Bradyrhizobium sp. 6(2017) TaxID=1197460 RepID=UPI0013E1E6C4|nr:hypothetical protein [Bradyrhizobium sp. 6(2017)]QIG97528.1 hypothetical protein G6P99_37565 [Bradyrhizobium sp. 6(2017)]